MKIVIDTSILIDYLRGGKAWEEFLSSANEDIELYLPTVVIFELFSGQSTREPKKEEEILNFLNQFQKIELNEDIAKRAGEIYRDTKVEIQVPDYIVAASALEVNGAVLTLNTKHFRNINGVKIYPV